jgi:hypothetical protein
MQTVWSRSLRSQSTCRCVSCINPLPSTLSRRSTTGIFRRRLNAGDAFNLLLGPVLGGALIADTSAKAKRRKQWDEKIAAVQAEVEQIRQNEVKPCGIRRRDLTRLPALSRNYSSRAAASLPVAEMEDSNEEVDCPSMQEFFYHYDVSAADIEDVPGPNFEPALGTAELQHVSNLDQGTIEMCRRLQRLVAIKLAIRMLLHIHIGKSPRYINTTSDYAYDNGDLPQDVNELVQHLKQVLNSLILLKSDNVRLSWRAYQELTRGKRSDLDQDVADLARRFQQGQMNVVQLIENFAGKLLSSSISPSVRGYIPLLTALSRARFDELGFMVDGTMIEARLPYDRHAVFQLLWQYGKNKEARCFDKLIKKLTTESANAQFGEQWLWKSIDGTLVPVPPSQDSSILQILIYAALKCNQPHRAEAWSTILAQKLTGNMWLSHVIRNFLRYYATHHNWHKGLLWMITALDRAEMLAAQGIRHVQRIAFSMLDFCVAHGKRGLYRDILQAAVECRLGVYSASADLTLTQRTTDILSEWKSCHEREHDEAIDHLSAVTKARIFTRKLRGLDDFTRGESSDHHTPRAYARPNRMSARGSSEVGANQNASRQGTSHNSGAAQDEVGAGHWKELCIKQQAQLDMLKQQLDSLKSEQNTTIATQGRIPVRGRLHAVEGTTHPRKGITFHAAALQAAAEQDGTLGRPKDPRMGPHSIPRPPLQSGNLPIGTPDMTSCISASKPTPHHIPPTQPPPPPKPPPPSAIPNHQPSTGPPPHAGSPFPSTSAASGTAPPSQPSKPRPILRFHPPRSREQPPHSHRHQQQPAVTSDDSTAPKPPPSEAVPAVPREVAEEEGSENEAPAAPAATPPPSLPITQQQTTTTTRPAPPQKPHHSMIRLQKTGSSIPIRRKFGRGQGEVSLQLGQLRLDVSVLK